MTLGDDVMQISLTAKFLGIHENVNMKWERYITILSKLLHSIFHRLEVMRQHATLDNLKILYYANLICLMASFFGVVPESFNRREMCFYNHISRKDRRNMSRFVRI